MALHSQYIAGEHRKQRTVDTPGECDQQGAPVPDIFYEGLLFF
jgi:hypothetical protein